MKNLLIISTFFIAVCSCKNEGTSSGETNILTFDSNNQKTIPINDKSVNFSLLSQVNIEDNGNQLFIHLNYFPSDPNYLFVNSFDDPGLDLVLEFESEGPNGVGSVTDFYFHSYDSIFLVDRYQYMVSLVDFSGKVKQSYRLKNSDSNRPDKDSVLPWSTSKSRMFLRGKFLYIPCNPDHDPFEHQYKKDNLLIKLNLETGDYTTLLGYPNWYQDGDYWGGPDHRIPSIFPLEDVNQLIVSFPLVDSVYLFDLQAEKMMPYFWMGSSNVETPVPINFADSQSEKGRRFQLATDYYFSINYDPYRKEFWRVFYKKYDEESIEKMINRESGKWNKKSVIVYDEKLKQIGEYELKEEWRVNPYDLIFLKEGVFMSEFSDSIEDQLVFRQLTIK